MATEQQIKAVLAECLDILASVSAANLAKRGDLLPSTVVNPYAIRRLADLVEDILPGAVARVRAGIDERRAEILARRPS